MWCKIEWCNIAMMYSLNKKCAKKKKPENNQKRYFKYWDHLSKSQDVWNDDEQKILCTTIKKCSGENLAEGIFKKKITSSRQKCETSGAQQWERWWTRWSANLELRKSVVPPQSWNAGLFFSIPLSFAMYMLADVIYQDFGYLDMQKEWKNAKEPTRFTAP